MTKKEGEKDGGHGGESFIDFCQSVDSKFKKKIVIDLLRTNHDKVKRHLSRGDYMTAYKVLKAETIVYKDPKVKKVSKKEKSEGITKIIKSPFKIVKRKMIIRLKYISSYTKITDQLGKIFKYHGLRLIDSNYFLGTFVCLLIKKDKFYNNPKFKGKKKYSKLTLDTDFIDSVIISLPKVSASQFYWEKPIYVEGANYFVIVSVPHGIDIIDVMPYV